MSDQERDHLNIEIHADDWAAARDKAFRLIHAKLAGPTSRSLLDEVQRVYDELIGTVETVLPLEDQRRLATAVCLVLDALTTSAYILARVNAEERDVDPRDTLAELDRALDAWLEEWRSRSD